VNLTLSRGFSFWVFHVKCLLFAIAFTSLLIYNLWCGEILREFSPHFSAFIEISWICTQALLPFLKPSSKSLTKQKWPHQNRAYLRLLLPPLQKASRQLLGGAGLLTLIRPISIFTLKMPENRTLPRLLHWRQRPTITKLSPPLKVSSFKCSPAFKGNWTSNGLRQLVNMRRLL